MMKWQWIFELLLLSQTLFLVRSADVDGSWNSWMEWTTCSVSCGDGYHVRSRICDNPEPEGNGANCSGLDYDTKPCKMDNCPIDGEWGSWEAWKGCTVTCGVGVTYRTRKCDNPAPQYNGSSCVGDSRHFDKCFERNCPVNGSWTNWSEYGECSKTCGYDIYRSRERNCTNPAPAYGGSDCVGDGTDLDLCQYVDCRDGTWEDWAAWGECSATCGKSIHFRFRNCSISASNGTCTGNDFQFSNCETPCPVDGNWGNWESWSKCSVTCEKGISTRKRACANPAPAFSGSNCIGDSIQTKNCTDPTPCPIDGDWTVWSSWYECDASCGGGFHVRLRRCSNPPPLYNGKICDGKDIEAQPCNTQPCPVNGEWGDWFPWDSCSSTCGTGTRSRIRTCSNPRPANGGTYCVGELEDMEVCVVSPDLTNCSLDGGWSSWGAWDSCSATCGDGVVTRSRNCSNPVPHGDGKDCVGSPDDTKPCSAPNHCVINGGWSDWRDWFACSATCGNGTQSRIRTCSNPRPQYGGEYCVGNIDETRDCTSQTGCVGDTSFVG
ncbi:Hemicentin-1 [Mactra antiquata]